MAVDHSPEPALPSPSLGRGPLQPHIESRSQIHASNDESPDRSGQELLLQRSAGIARQLPYAKGAQAAPVSKGKTVIQPLDAAASSQQFPAEPLQHARIAAQHNVR